MATPRQVIMHGEWVALHGAGDEFLTRTPNWPDEGDTIRLYRINIHGEPVLIAKTTTAFPDATLEAQPQLGGTDPQSNPERA